jgi:spore germination cell wall hydrolase CwlJ-like protein
MKVLISIFIFCSIFWCNPLKHKEIPENTYEDFLCLFVAVYHEARGESTRGQELVARVILNRVQHKNYPSDVCSVVKQSKQFSNINKTFMKLSKTSYKALNEETKGKVARVAYNALSQPQAVPTSALHSFLELPRGVDGRVHQGMTHYHHKSIKPYWSRGMIRVHTEGNHVFYRGKT